MKERHSQPKQITQETSKIKQKKNQLQNKIYLPWLLITDKKKINTETFGSLYVCVL